MRPGRKSTVAYLTPYGGHHEVASVVAVRDQARRHKEFSVRGELSLVALMRQRGHHSRERRLGDLDPWTVQVLLETSIQLSQSTVLQVGNTLLLVLDITPRSQFVGGHFGVGMGDEVREGERERGVFGSEGV